MPAGSGPLGFIRKLEEQGREEGARFQGALGAQARWEYLHGEGSTEPLGKQRSKVDLLPSQQCPQGWPGSMLTPQSRGSSGVGAG